MSTCMRSVHPNILLRNQNTHRKYLHTFHTVHYKHPQTINIYIHILNIHSHPFTQIQIPKYSDIHWIVKTTPTLHTHIHITHAYTHDTCIFTSVGNRFYQARSINCFSKWLILMKNRFPFLGYTMAYSDTYCVQTYIQQLVPNNSHFL